MTKQLTLAVIAASYAASAAVYRKVPEPDFGIGPYLGPWTGRALITFLLPTAALLTCGLLSWLWTRDPVRERSDSLETTFQALVFRIILLIVGLHALILASLVSGHNLVQRAVPILLGLAVVSIGDLLPRLKPNIAIGLRSSSTFENRRVWIRTHRFAGYTTVSLGAVIILAGSFLPRPTNEAAILAAAMAAAVALVWHSRKLGRCAEDGKH